MIGRVIPGALLLAACGEPAAPSALSGEPLYTASGSRERQW